MTLFAIFAALLLALVAAFILPPLWLGIRSNDQMANRKVANLAIFRDQLAELERENNAGTLAESEFESARLELQRRLLEEVEPEDAAALATPAIAGSSRKTAVALLVLMPILALIGYALLGNTKALDPTQTAAPPQMTAEQIDGMVAKLAERMQANPDDMKGWLMLARSYKTMGRYEEAAQAYGKAEKLVNEDPDLLASYAETLAMANGKGLQGKPRELALRALKLDAKHPHSLFLAGAAALEAGDNKQGIAYWETLLPDVEPGSEIDQMLRSGIEKMKQGQ
ncbi:MAG: c-type cytochrome biogenesis protein CcmI [Azonexus sp.]|nr:c-type cytochrome biogenesis protein CcmI [Azonexus sp.]MDP3636598.1 c-type cytochrome biogenesis protein CcmI [Azonexus sp.]MDZ4316229.1 c-type cytochrome biogenesis protein CcmI [Azonexus sp.]